METLNCIYSYTLELHNRKEEQTHGIEGSLVAKGQMKLQKLLLKQLAGNWWINVAQRTFHSPDGKPEVPQAIGKRAPSIFK